MKNEVLPRSLYRILASFVAIGTLTTATTQAQVLLEENFTTAGALTSNGWTQIGSATTNALTSAGPALDYANLPSSGVGNAAALVNTGQDAYRAFGTTETGTIYTSFLVDVSAALVGDYFYAFYNQATTGGGYNGRVWIRSDGSGGFNFGVAKNTGTAASVDYETTARTFGTTYLVVMKLTRNAGSTTDDVASLWINPALGVSEPSPDLNNSVGNDNTIGFTSVALRQGGSTDSPSLRLGNILVGTTWASVTPSTSSTAPIIDSFSPASGEVGSTVVITGLRFGAAPAVRFNGIAAPSTVNPAGTEITATVPAGATTGPISVEVAGEPVATSSGNFTVVDPLAPTLSTSGSLTAFNTIFGTPSTSQSFTVSGANLGGNVTVTAPTGFEVSSDNSAFASAASLAPVGGVLNAVPVYARIAGSAAAGPVSGNITIAASGATTLNVPASGTVGAPISYVTLVNTNANSYTQNFDTLGTTTISNAVSLTVGVQTSLGSAVANTLDGWYAAKIAGSGGISNIVADSGGGSSGAVYNYGSTNAPANTDRSLGGLATGSFTPGFGALIKNETGQALQGVQISFISKLWRSSTVSNSLTFGYGLVDGSAFTTANFLTATNASALAAANVVYPPAASNVAVDGNLPANQIAFNNVVIPQAIAPGETLFIRWQDVDGSGSDAGMAIDNVSLTALADAPPATAPFVAPASAPADQITRTQAGLSSSVTGDGGAAITARGFVYAVASVNPEPTLGGTGVVDAPNETSEVGPMVQTITGLTAGTTYAVRSYASNSVGTTYSAAITFTTVSPPLSFTGSYGESFSSYTGTLPAGWSATSSSNSLTYGGLWGTGSSGGFRGVGETTGNVLGYQHTGSTGQLTVSVTFVNDTGDVLDTLNVSYLGRTAVPANTRTPAWAVTVAGIPVEALAYSTGNTEGEGGAPADLEVAAQVSGLTIAPDAEFTVTWVSQRGTEGQLGSSRQIGLADFAMSSGTPPPNPYNGWASSYGLDPSVTTGPNAGAPAADPDNDTFTNQQEFSFGTNPTVGSPALLSTELSGGNLVVRWLERAGVTYTPQSTANLATTAFANDGTVTVVNGPVSPTPPAGYTRKQFTVPATAQKFYRVRATTP
jgi:hypothetical protein